MRCGFRWPGWVPLFLVVSATEAEAQRARTGRLTIEREGQPSFTSEFPATSFRVSFYEVRESRCRSCVGQHTSYEARIVLARGPLQQVELSADIVGGRAVFHTGTSRYPGAVSLRVWMRNGTAPSSLQGSFTREVVAADAPLLRLRFVPRTPEANTHIRSILFEYPRVPRGSESALR